ncbi:MAG: hypothetical protein ABWX57_09265 [Aeromicrobium sp.]
MTRIIIDDVDNVEDLLNALATVQAAFAAGRAEYDSRQEYFSQTPENAADRVGPLPPRRGEVRRILPDLPGPTPFVPCPRRGEHLRLTDCWLCWSDVQRRDCAAVDVLSSQAWDLALVALAGGADHRDRALPTTPGPHAGE